MHRLRQPSLSSALNNKGEKQDVLITDDNNLSNTFVVKGFVEGGGDDTDFMSSQEASNEYESELDVATSISTGTKSPSARGTSTKARRSTGTNNINKDEAELLV